MRVPMDNLIAVGPFNHALEGLMQLDCPLQHLIWPFSWANGTRTTARSFHKNITAGDLEFGPRHFRSSAAPRVHRSAFCHSCNHLRTSGVLARQAIGWCAQGRRHGFGRTDYGIRRRRSWTSVDSVDACDRDSQFRQSTGGRAQEYVPQQPPPDRRRERSVVLAKQNGHEQHANDARLNPILKRERHDAPMSRGRHLFHQ